jgi:hypothetical protein
MGAVPPTLKTNARAATRALNASNQTLRKERSDIDSLIGLKTQQTPEMFLTPGYPSSLNRVDSSEGGDF